MLTYFVLLCMTVAATLAAGPCDSDADKFYKCLKDSRPKPPEHAKEAGGDDKRAEFEELMKKRSACFTDKGCKVPQQGDDDRGKGESKGKGDIDWSVLKKCGDASGAKIKTCVGNDHFPEPPEHEGGPGKGKEGGKEGGPRKEGGPHKEGGPPHKEGGPGGPDFHAKADPTDCPAADAVNKCLDALKPPHKEGPGYSKEASDKEAWVKRQVDECNKRKEAEKKCEDAMTAQCKKSLQDTKAKLCSCAKTEEPNFEKCVGSSGPKGMAGMFLHQLCDEGSKCEDGPPHKA
jgi:hypothetical protein